MKTYQIWHPYTQMKTAPPALKVKSASGIMLELENGQQIMDCISSWWVTLHGHAQPEIAAAIAEQARKLELVIFAGFTHSPAEQLIQGLLEFLPSSLNHFFYSDNGSTAVEIALKMAYQFWKNQDDQQRTKFIAFEGAYHGDTFGAMSVGARSVFTKPFEELLFDVDFVPFPATFNDDPAVVNKEQQALTKIENLLAQTPAQYAGMIIEPLVQGAGGMRMCRPEFLQQLAQLCRQYQTLLIYDEVMTGFGRTGDWFAATKSQTQPDIICLAKGLTGGFLPLALTACTQEIYQAFHSDIQAKALFHGHSQTANPIACAAGIASLQLLKQNIKKIQQIHQWHHELMPILNQEKQLVNNLRICGTIIAMDVITPEQTGYLNSINQILKQTFIEQGFLLRPLGNILYLLPPYCITYVQLKSAYQIIQQVLSKL